MRASARAGPLHRGRDGARPQHEQVWRKCVCAAANVFPRDPSPSPDNVAETHCICPLRVRYEYMFPVLWAWLSGMPLCHLTAVAMKHVIGRRHSTSTVVNVNVKCERSTFLRYLRALRDCVMLNCSPYSRYCLMFPHEKGAGAAASCRNPQAAGGGKRVPLDEGST